MNENKSYLLKGAMTYGFVLGIYWVVKYIFLILGGPMSLLSMLYLVLTAAVPFVAYLLTKRYKQEIGGMISFFHAWRFGVLLYFFAALIVSLAHFAYYQFFAPQNFLLNATHQLLDLMKQSNVDTELIESIGKIQTTPIHMAIQGIFNNVFYGIIFSIPVAAIISRDKQPKDAGVTEHNAEQQ